MCSIETNCSLGVEMKFAGEYEGLSMYKAKKKIWENYWNKIIIKVRKLQSINYNFVFFCLLKYEKIKFEPMSGPSFKIKLKMKEMKAPFTSIYKQSKI